MRKVVSGILIAVGLYILRFLGVWNFPGFTQVGSGDRYAFERAAYQYLGWFVGLALIALGAVIALWPARAPKPPPPSFDDPRSRRPENDRS
jgi:hypothetical protein